MSIVYESYDFSAVELFQDPIYETLVEKEVFILNYESLLRTLDGSDMSAYVDFFFVPSPLASHVLLFVDEDARMDFRDMARDMGLVPEMKEVMEGEDQVAKIQRQSCSFNNLSSSQSPNLARQIAQNEKRREKSKANALTKRTEHARRSLDTLMHRLERETEPNARHALNEKISRTIRILDNTV